jgi:hypothetical protein
MEIELSKFEDLLSKFDKLPKTLPHPTYLEICQYPGSRQEEICSRILSFYFAPQKEHGCRDLFLSSLLELLTNDIVQYKYDQIVVKNEENAEGKRLDILIYSPDFAIGIENKISASVYNPLEVYKYRIEQYNKYAFKVVLTARTISARELKIITENDFVVITYNQLFDIIKRKVGSYISQCNQKYLTFLFDFIQTIENMNEGNILNDQISSYFYDNSQRIEELIKLYGKYNDAILVKQKERISDLREKISKLTGVEWWAWQGWDLRYGEFNENKPRIGIECSYKMTKNDPLGEFRIYITTWKINDWTPYEKSLLEKYPNKFLDKPDNRVYLHMDIIKNDEEELILKRLKEYYDTLVEITR